MSAALTGLFAGLVFGVGLVIAGMTQPSNVLAFLDVAGEWDPSLALVMVSAIAVYATGYRWLVRRMAPLYAEGLARMTLTKLDAPLIVGAAIFGVGWGIGGFCPGPGVVAAGGGAPLGIAFALSMVAGMGLFELYQSARGQQPVSSMSDDAPLEVATQPLDVGQ